MELKLPKYLDQAQVKAILQAAYKRSLRDGVIVDVTYWLGLRVSEVVRLDREHYKAQAGRIAINRSKGSVSGECEVLAGVRKRLDEYLAARSDKCSSLFKGRQGRLSSRAVELVFDASAISAGVELNPGQSIHALRHSIAVHLLEAGWDVREVQVHLGHRRIESTLVYAQITDRRRRERIQALETSQAIARLD